MEPLAVRPPEAAASLGIHSFFLFLPDRSSLSPSLLLPWDPTFSKGLAHQLWPQTLLSREPRPREGKRDTQAGGSPIALTNRPYCICSVHWNSVYVFI